MKYLSLIITIPLTIIVVCFALLNQSLMTLTFFPQADEAIEGGQGITQLMLPEAFQAFTEFSVPAYIVIFAVFFMGFLFGGLAAWPKSFSARRQAKKSDRTAKKLEKDKTALTTRLEAAEEKEKIESSAMVIDVPSTQLSDGTL